MYLKFPTYKMRNIGAHSLSKPNSALELKELIKVPNGFDAFATDESIILTDGYEFQEYSISGKYLGPISKFSKTKIDFICKTSDLFILSSSTLHTRTKSINLPFTISSDINKILELNSSFLFDFRSYQTLLTPTSHHYTTEIPSKLCEILPSLNTFIVISNSEVNLITPQGLIQRYSHKHQNSSFFSIKNLLLISVQDKFIYLDSIPSMIPIRKLTLSQQILDIHFYPNRLHGGNCIILYKNHLSLQDFADNSVKFETKADKIQILALGLFLINGFIYKLQVRDEITRVKDLLLEEKFRAAGDLTQKLQRNSKNFLSQVVESLCADSDCPKRYWLACEYLSCIRNLQDSEVQVLTHYFLNDDKLNIEDFALAVTRICELLAGRDEELGKIVKIRNKFYVFCKSFKDQGTDWLEFKKASCAEQIGLLFENLDPAQAVQLFDSCSEMISNKELFEILDKVDFSSGFFFIKHWFSMVLPGISNDDNLRFWMLEKTQQLVEEQKDSEEVLEFLEIYLKTCEKSEGLDELVKIQEDLKTLIHLKAKYRICLSLCRLHEETDFSISFEILNELRPDVFDRKLGLLTDFCKEKKLELDLVLASFIISKTEEQFQFNDPNWENVVAMLIHSIKNDELRSKSILNVLTNSFLISPKTYEELINYALSFENSYKISFVQLKQAEDFKLINQKYTSEVINTNSQTNLVRFVSFMLNSPILTSINDALWVGQMIKNFGNFEILLLILESVAEDKDFKRIEGMKSTWDRVDEKDEYFASLLFYLACGLMDQKVVESEWVQKRFEESCLGIVKLIEMFGEVVKSWKWVMDRVKNMMDLAQKFGIYLTFWEYSDKRIRKSTMKSCIKSYFEYTLIQVQNLTTNILDTSPSKISTKDSLIEISSLLLYKTSKLLLKLCKLSSIDKSLHSQTISYLAELSKLKLSNKELDLALSISLSLINSSDSELIFQKLRPIFESILFINLKDKQIAEKCSKVISHLQNIESIIESRKNYKSNELFINYSENLDMSCTELHSISSNYFKLAIFDNEAELTSLICKLSQLKASRSALFLIESFNLSLQKESQSMIETFLEHQFESACKSPNLSEDLVLTLMIQLKDSEKVNESLNEIYKTLSNFQNSIKICNIGKNFNTLIENPEQVQYWQKNQKISTANFKLHKFDITIEDIETIQESYDQIKFLFSRQAPLDLALELTSHFDWDSEEVIMGYLKRLITRPVLKKSLCPLTQAASYPYIYPFKTNFIKETKNLVTQLTKQNASDLLIECFQMICEIDYVRIIFVIEMLVQYDSKFAHIKDFCKFLKKYSRKSKPSNEELALIKENPNLTSDVRAFFNKGVEKCLGISFLNKTIEKEICLDNCFEFVRLAMMVCKDQRKIDDLFCKAVKNEVSFSIERTGQGPRFEDLEPFLAKVKDTKFLVDLINGISYAYASSDDILKLRKVQREKIEKKESYDLNLFDRVVAMDRVNLCLYKNDLYSRFKDLTLDSNFLTEIYNHLLPFSPQSSQSLDSNLLIQLVTEVLNIINLPFSKFHQKLIHSWLQETETNSQNQNLNLNLKPNSQPCFSISLLTNQQDPNLMKTIDLLKLFPNSDLHNYLNQLLKSENEKSYLVKARILSIFQATNQELKTDFNHLIIQKNLIRFYYYLADFQALEIECCTNELSDIQNLTFKCKSLLTSFNPTKQHLQLASCILIENEIKDFTLFSLTIDLMIESRDFESIVIFISSLNLFNKFYFVRETVRAKQGLIFVEAAKILKGLDNLQRFVDSVLVSCLEKETLLEIIEIFAKACEDEVVYTGFYLVKELDEYFQTYLLSLLVKANFEKMQKFSYLLGVDLDFKSRQGFLLSAHKNLKDFGEFFSP